ncbi:3-methyl-2-oxobutanoate hydroxymethyltransferase [Myroides indicus]|uniref:3-methyl-2-oxobutanoate hydroxymethyltransferase n=1 Tax=Myroides indicus TaxID=1323422 RepID=A0A4V3E8W8_9FLAO|nr:3-methyl-2-oxobutanoate hydroxymethyltransferase [Myroides indicus]TDS62115.1 3-methyl-2-oxobutanoate hydroxymethyltransferase [Myroides indicus]
MKKTLEYLKEKAKNNQKISALTAYDYPTTKILEEAKIDMIILGDSVGTNVLGYNNETEVTLEDIIHHTKAVYRAIKNIFLVVDLPFQTYDTPKNAVNNAKKLIALGADAVKFEGINLPVLKALKAENIPVMCHIGLNPQHEQERMQRGKVAKGKSLGEATELINGAKILSDNGADLMILEKIPEKVSKIISENISTITIGIGGGKFCNGQILIINDLFGLNERKFKHCPEYIELRNPMIETVKKYIDEVGKVQFPEKHHANIIKEDEYNKLVGWCKENNIKV